VRVTDAQVARALGKPLDEVDGWGERGRCAETDPEAWFPEKGASTRNPKQVCMGGCEVREECLTYALLNGERFGVWGGLSERERRQIQRRGLTPAEAVYVRPAAVDDDQDDEKDDEKEAAA
jgi:WhiB family redox-sensing transcriptional regulator